MKMTAHLLVAALLVSACGNTLAGRGLGLDQGSSPGQSDAPAVEETSGGRAVAFDKFVKDVGTLAIGLPLVALVIVSGDPNFLNWIIDELD